MAYVSDKRADVNQNQVADLYVYLRFLDCDSLGFEVCLNP